MNLGSNDKGLVGFSWENIPDEIKKIKQDYNSSVCRKRSSK